MKQILILLSIILVGLASCKTKEDTSTKITKLVVKQAEENLLFENAIQALNDKRYVIEADRITFKYGYSTNVSTTTNFIALHDNKATIQIAFNSPHAGPNGIGGITVEGTASNIKMKTDKKGNVIYSMSVMGARISADVHFTLTKGSNQVSATVTSNFKNNRITFIGFIYPESESTIFKGRSF